MGTEVGYQIIDYDSVVHLPRVSGMTYAIYDDFLKFPELLKIQDFIYQRVFNISSTVFSRSSGSHFVPDRSPDPVLSGSDRKTRERNWPTRATATSACILWWFNISATYCWSSLFEDCSKADARGVHNRRVAWGSQDRTSPPIPGSYGWPQTQARLSVRATHSMACMAWYTGEA